MNVERGGEMVSFAELEQITFVAEQMWQGAASSPEQYKGFQVAHDGERAAFTLAQGAVHDRLSVFRGEAKVWYVEEQSQRPTLEDIGFGKVMQSTTTHALIPGEPSTQTVAYGHLAKNGELVEAEYDQVAFGDPLSTADCLRLLAGFRTIRGEDEARLPGRKPQGSWLRKLGLIR